MRYQTAHLRGLTSGICWVIPLVTALLLSAGVYNSQGGEQRILFAHLKFEGEKITLISASIRPGKLKSIPRTGALQLDLLDEAGNKLRTFPIPNPLVERLEYEDPENPGKLLIKEVRRNSAEITVRIPFSREGKKLKISRKTSGGAGKKDVEGEPLAILAVPEGIAQP